jgi:hypothetical protein
MHRSLRLPIALLGFVIILAFLAGGSFLLNKWLPQPAIYAPSTGSPPGNLAVDPLDYLPDTGLVQLTSPLSTASYYITTFDSTATKDLGRALGNRDGTTFDEQDDLVILDYGYPVLDPSGAYGVNLIYDQNHIFHSNAEVANSVFNFAKGYFENVFPDRGSKLKIVVGVNNCCEAVVPGVFVVHGSRWATEVVDVVKSQIEHTTGMSSQVDVIAGILFHPAPQLQTP